MNIVACSVTVDAQTASRGLALRERNSDILKNFVGIHPEASARSDVDAFGDMCSKNKAVIDGIGEIGLDRTYDESGIAPYPVQKKVFSNMLALAESSRKPVSIHSRKSLDDILEILPSYNLEGALLHWFAGSKKQLAKAADLALYVSFGPVLVYSDEKKVLLSKAPRERILVETDGPVAYSHCFGNLPASPTSFLVSVVTEAARVLGVTFDEAAQLFERNSLSFLA